MRKTKITVTIDATLVEKLNHWSEQRKKSRSHLVEEALKSWHWAQIEQELMAGYRAMAQEDVETAKAFLAAGVEVLT